MEYIAYIELVEYTENVKRVYIKCMATSPLSLKRTGDSTATSTFSLKGKGDGMAIYIKYMVTSPTSSKEGMMMARP